MQLNKVKLKKQAQRFLVFYGITFLISWVVLFLLIYVGNGRTLKQAWSILVEVCLNILSHPFYWILLLIPFLLFLLVKGLISNYRKKGTKGLLIGLSLKVILPLLLLFTIKESLQYYRLSESFDYTWDHTVENSSSYIQDFEAQDDKQRGIHTFNIASNLNDIEKLKTHNFEWITLTPFIWQANYNEPEMGIPSEVRFQETKERYTQIKEECDKYGIRIMLKPHIWMRENVPGKWRSNIEMNDSDQWDLWFDNYEKVMLMYAQIAQDLGFEQFCVGTELESTVREKPEKWSAFIQNVKTVYTGKLTYAANWNREYQEVPFWSELDYIGIQAYFPLSDGGNPSLEQLEDAWQPFISEMKEVSDRFQKPVLFTEMGYRSLQGTSRIPWEWGSFSHWFSKISKKEQYHCYESFFNTVWKQPWFHGVHIWEWQGSMTHGDNTSFSIEFKPAMNLVAKRFVSP
ncbi:hypothetical protein POV27_00815 [Aureisphaera galaxeae]|uniref:glycoside hydrolase family 113 n=1 Tax=Aureisphaera galaxeae TaxID=1538023 RepID=UPI002350656D|nr:hypothetical protein [Aureisphaera galaxeae]MDC8002578.1 hypothetical protein [Aureisphaera galaxeae]